MRANLVLLRHGHSEWNGTGRFSGWEDVPLTAIGATQARSAGAALRQAGFDVDLCFTSVLKRATHTAWHCLDAMDCTWVHTVRSWRLNERHYGALHGLGKSDIAKRYGDQQVRLWRRSFDTRPPRASPQDASRFANDPRYASAEVPDCESMADTVERVMPFWTTLLKPALDRGSRALVVAHGTSLRALLKIVRNLGDDITASMEIPNAIPIALHIPALPSDDGDITAEAARTPCPTSS